MTLPAGVALQLFPISRDPPEGGTVTRVARREPNRFWFPISRDPPEGGTSMVKIDSSNGWLPFPISRDPPEGGTVIHLLW